MYFDSQNLVYKMCMAHGCNDLGRQRKKLRILCQTSFHGKYQRSLATGHLDSAATPAKNTHTINTYKLKSEFR